MRRIAVAVSFTLLVAMPGCSNSRAIELGVVLAHSNCKNAREGVSRVTLEEVAALRGSRLLGAEAAPKVVGASPPMIAVSTGERPSAGYALALDGPATLEQGVLLVRVAETTPGPDSMQAQVITHPCLVLELPETPWTVVRVLDAAGNPLGEINR